MALLRTGLLCIVLTGCRADRPQEYHPVSASLPARASTRPEYRLGVPPMRTTRDLWVRYAPIVDSLNLQVTDFNLHLESALTFSAYDAKLRKTELDIAFVEPHRVLELEDLGYEVVARAGDRDRIAGVLTVRSDSDLRSPRGLSGKRICFSSPTALASALIKAELKESGIDLEKAAQVSYAEDERSAIMNVIADTADAAGISRSGWERYQGLDHANTAGLRVLHQTQDLPGVAVMAHRRIPGAHVRQLAAALLSLVRSESGKTALHNAGFTELRHGESASYDELWEFLVKYRRLFGSAPRRGSS